MNNEEINRYLHVEIMGKCWHGKSMNQWCFPPIPCDVCGKPEEDIPDYCSDDSPRRLLREVVSRICASQGVETYLPHLKNITRQTDTTMIFEQLEYLANPTAEQIARASVEAHKLTAKPAA